MAPALHKLPVMAVAVTVPVAALHPMAVTVAPYLVPVAMIMAMAAVVAVAVKTRAKVDANVRSVAVIGFCSGRSGTQTERHGGGSGNSDQCLAEHGKPTFQHRANLANSLRSRESGTRKMNGR
jgi:hypothetical protein